MVFMRMRQAGSQVVEYWCVKCPNPELISNLATALIERGLVQCETTDKLLACLRVVVEKEVRWISLLVNSYLVKQAVRVCA